ncbi:MAG: hypothetical protein CMM47_04690 [Rhodospirillaceae bacterium]|nr:hypothetical protein [Rhodospirillaceae bacterium]
MASIKGVYNVGEFPEGDFHGEGKYYYADGDIYVGEWDWNNEQGQGTYYYLADNRFRGDKYVGEFKSVRRTARVFTPMPMDVWKSVFFEDDEKISCKPSSSRSN